MKAPSWCLRTDWRSQPTGASRRVSTMYPQEFGRRSTFLLVAPFRKARVVGPACTRSYPSFFASFREETEKRSKIEFGFRSCFGRLEARVSAQVFPTRSTGCKLRGGPKISRRMIASRKPDFDASKVAMSVFNSAPLATPKAFGAA
jgi:hypothetical protein